MKVRTKFVISVVLAVPLLVAIVIGCREYNEQRKKREEEILNALVIDSLNLVEASGADVARLIERNVHAKGHPEFQVRIYSDSRQVPHFHALQNPSPYLEPSYKITAKLTSIPLAELIKFVSGLGVGTFELAGHELIVLPVPGTTRPFRRAVYKMYPEFFGTSSEKHLTDYVHNLNSYEGMTFEINRQESTIEIFAPEHEVEMLDGLLYSAKRPSWWEQAQSIVRFQKTIPRDY
jgi:hypothetical protein